MRIIPFPQRNVPPGEQPLGEIEAALHGDAPGANAQAWRQLRNDVRSLAPPMSPELEQELRRRIESQAAATPRARAGTRVGARVRGALASFNAWLAVGLRAHLLALSGVSVAALVVALVIVAPWGGGQSARPAMGTFAPAVPVKSSAAGVPSTDGVAASPALAENAAPPGRVQQRSASVTLAAKPEEVQSVADQVAQLTVRDGGFVQGSHVQVQTGKPGEATLSLSVPSSHLSDALGELGRLAPMRTESQGLQDITGEFEAVKRQLADDEAQRRALLRALARASSQGEIESIRDRLSLVGSTISRDRSVLQSVSRRGSNSNVEVTVLGDAHPGGSGLTLGNALHDADDVLRVALAVLIIALAVLVPMLLLLALVGLALRATRRRLRERALS